MLELIRWLPDTSAYAASIRGGPKWRGWGQDRLIAARTFDAVNINTTVTAKAAAGKKGRKLKPPKPWPLPSEVKTGDTSPKPKFTLRQLADNINRPRRRR